MLIPKKERKEIYKYLFKEGVLWAPKDYSLPKHPEVDVKNLYVIKAMQSFESKELVTCRYAWRNYYWFLTDAGIEYLREYLNIPTEVVPATLMMAAGRRLDRGMPGGGRGGGGPGRGGGGGWRGDRDDYRSGPREGGFGRGRPMGGGPDKVGAPANYTPQFQS